MEISIKIYQRGVFISKKHQEAPFIVWIQTRRNEWNVAENRVPAFSGTKEECEEWVHLVRTTQAGVI